MKKISGLYTALVTPFKSNGQLDEEGLCQNIRDQIAGGVTGIVPIGSTGESPTLSDQEKTRIIKICVEEAKGKVQVVVGTGSYCTDHVIEDTQIAKDLGADSVMIVCPYYNKPTQEGLYRHYAAITKAVQIPITIYNVLCRTNVNMQTDTLKRLADLPNIVAVKEASGSIQQIMEVIDTLKKHRPDFSVVSGDDNLTYATMVHGGDGVISVASNLIPKLIRKMVYLLDEEEYTAARELHYQLLPLFLGIFVETNPIPIKAAMSMCGKPAGECRLPLCELAPSSQRKLRSILEQLQLIPEACAAT